MSPPKHESGLVTVYQHGSRLYIVANRLSTSGFWVSVDRARIVATEDSRGLEQALTAAFEETKGRVPDPSPSPAKLSASLRDASGIQSWEGFAEAVTCVDVYRAGNSITVTPYRRAGVCFDPIVAKARRVAIEPGLGGHVHSALADAV